MNIKDAYVHVGPSGTNEKALLKDFAITAAQITLTRAIQNDAGTGDKTETITIPTWNQSTTGNAATATLADKVKGSYTGNGGQQNPNYFGTSKVGFLMMNTTVNGNTQYKDWIIMDCYNGNDVGGGVAFGVNRQSLGAYIMRSASARTSWEQSAELLGTHNYNLYAVPLSGGTMTGALTVPSLSVTGAATFSQAINGSILGNAATASRLQNARTISLTGSVTGSGSFDGSGNLSIATSTNHNHNSAYMTACALFTGASAATSATASLTNGNVYLNATKTINGTATNVGSIKISGSTGISVTTDANGHITVTGTTSYLRAGATGATANVTSATSNPYLALVEGTTQSSQVQLFASTGISISANNGVITFTNTSTNSHTYTSTWTAKTDNVNYPIAFSPNATPATSGNGYNTGFTFNPGTKTFNNNGCRQQYDSTNKVLKFIFD